MKTRHDITVSIFPYPRQYLIPAGTRCDPARNLPGDGLYYWVKASRKMDKQTREACNNVGIILTRDAILSGGVGYWGPAPTS